MYFIGAAAVAAITAVSSSMAVLEAEARRPRPCADG
jgi:hypothetical protein